MNVSAVLVTRGNVDMRPVLDSLPAEWEKVVWDNGSGLVTTSRLSDAESFRHDTNLSVYGRYAAIQYATSDLVFVQDDDVIVSDPQAIVDGLILNYGAVVSSPFALAPGAPLPPVTHVQIAKDRVVCNMPQEFRHEGYTDSALVGFGACFHRLLPDDAFYRWRRHHDLMGDEALIYDDGVFLRTCDVVFTTLTDRVLVDVPKVNREFAEDADRMYRQPDHVGERARMLGLARKVRGA